MCVCSIQIGPNCISLVASLLINQSCWRCSFPLPQLPPHTLFPGLFEFGSLSVLLSLVVVAVVVVVVIRLHQVITPVLFQFVATVAALVFSLFHSVLSSLTTTPNPQPNKQANFLCVTAQSSFIETVVLAVLVEIQSLILTLVCCVRIPPKWEDESFSSDCRLKLKSLADLIFSPRARAVQILFLLFLAELVC